MARYQGTMRPGDVVCTRSEGWGARLIRFGAALRGQPNLVNHIAIAHHVDDAGVLWGVEGRSGGVGWVDMRGYMKNPLTNVNTAQPKTNAQISKIMALSVQLLGTPYDWSAIVTAGMQALRMDKLWRGAKDFGGTVPGHVICSSFADWIYEEVGLASPGNSDGTRFTTPADWDRFIMEAKW